MHIVHGELRKAPYIKQGVGGDGQSTMFAIELSEMIKDYKTGEKTYTNYKAILFAKSPAHVAHYQSTLVEGNFVVVNCEKLKIEVSECGQYTKLYMDNARLEGSGYIANNNQPHQQAPQQQQGGFQQQQQQSQARQQTHQAMNQNAQQNQQGSTQFDDDIPF